MRQEDSFSSYSGLKSVGEKDSDPADDNKDNDEKLKLQKMI